MKINYNSIIEKVLNSRWWILIIVFFLTGYLLMQIQYIKVDNSNESAFIKGDSQEIVLKQFKEDFGNDDFAYILIKNTGSVFNQKYLQTVKRLTSELNQKVPYLKQLTWLGNYEYIRSTKDGIIINDLMPKIPQNNEEFKRLRNSIENTPSLINNLISKNYETLAILLEFYPYPLDKVGARKEVAPAINEILSNFTALETYVVGGPIINYEYDQISASEGKKLGLISIIIIMLILFITMRKVMGVIIPLSIVILSVIWTLGIISLTGIPISMMVIMLPALIICIGIADSMHILVDFKEENDVNLTNREAITATLSRVAMPCLLTTLTTSIGFMSFQGTSIQPLRDMGLFSAIGVFITFVLTLVLVPIFLSFFSAKQEKDKSISRTDKFLLYVSKISINYPRSIIASFVVIILLSLWGYQFVKVETNTINAISSDTPLRKAYDLVDSDMGGSMSLEIVLDSGSADGIKEPSFLNQVDKLQTFISKHSLVKQTTSVVDSLKQIRKSLNNNNQDFYSLPASREQIAQYLFIYETSGGGKLNNFVSFEYDKVRINVRTSGLSTLDVRNLTNDIQNYSNTHISKDITVHFTGVLSLLRVLSDYIAQGQKSSFLLALVSITIIMMIVLRSIPLGLISITPNVVPVIIGLGIMGYSGIYMHMVLVIFAPIIIAVAVDDTIFFFFRFKKQFSLCSDYKLAIEQTICSVGRPLLYTTLILVIGFSSFCFSIMDNYSDFGLLSAIAFSFALLADFLLVPALLILIKPLGNKNSHKKVT